MLERNVGRGGGNGGDDGSGEMHDKQGMYAISIRKLINGPPCD